MSARDLVCRGLVRTHRRRIVLAGVDLDVAAGSTLVLLGSSGAGKTTLLRIVAGLDRAKAGTVSLGGTLLSDPAILIPPEGRKIGMVFQALELWPQMTVAEHIAFGLHGRPRGRRARRNKTVRALAEQVGLDEALLRRRPATLSGGEQQRAAIARTLAATPDVVLYDEPLANLDPDRRRSLRALIRRLAREHGTTVVYVTHDPEEALEIGDEIAVMDRGQIIERGAPEDVYARPHTLAGARALGPVTLLSGTCRAGRVVTAMGEVAATNLRAADGACRVLWRPEGLRVTSQGGTAMVVDDVVARGRDWAFRASLDGAVIHGRAPDRVEVGATVQVTAGEPVAVLAPEASMASAGERAVQREEISA